MRIRNFELASGVKRMGWSFWALRFWKFGSRAVWVWVFRLRAKKDCYSLGVGLNVFHGRGTPER